MAKTSTSPAHTAGPWRTDSIGHDQTWILDTEGNYIAEIVEQDDCGFVCPKAQQEANARLIAAAPELLEALKRIRGVYDLNGSQYEVFEEAMSNEAGELIAKAEGHS